MIDDDDVCCSRSGRSDSGGKMAARLDVPVTAELEEAVIAMAALAGVPKAEFVRGVLERALFGEFGAMRRSVAAGRAYRQWDQCPTADRGAR